jgi:broad specificity phosphatase PhoE
MKTFVGWQNVPADLSDTAAIARLEAALPAEATVISSDLVRCVATADAITGARQRLPNDPHLRELHFGAWDGRVFSDVSDRDPDLSRAYWEKPGDVAPPGGESWNRAAARVRAAVRRIEAQHAGPFIAVAHLGVILTQVQETLGLTAEEAISHKIDNLSLTVLDRAAGRGEINQRL